MQVSEQPPQSRAMWRFHSKTLGSGAQVAFSWSVRSKNHLGVVQMAWFSFFDSYCFSFVYSYVTCQQNLSCSWSVCGTLISRRTAWLLLLPGAVITSTFIYQAVILWLSMWVALVTFNNTLLLQLALGSAQPLHTCLLASDCRDLGGCH